MTPKYEKAKLQQGFHYIIGCDEVGRGCLAGPVVAAAVVLDLTSDVKVLREVDDSKVLSPHKREELSELIKDNTLAWSIGSVSQEEVDKINIHNASLLAMRKAVESLSLRVQPKQSSLMKDCRVGQSKPWPSRNDSTLVLIDGKFKIPDLNFSQEVIIDGDAKILSIAAASIIAKVYRDGLMKQFDEQYPNYQFGKHKGYATAIHRTAIKNFGLTPLHRLSFCGQYL